MNLATDIGDKASKLFLQHYNKMLQSGKTSKSGNIEISCSFKITAEITSHPQSDNPGYESEVVLSFTEQTKDQMNGSYNPDQQELNFEQKSGAEVVKEMNEAFVRDNSFSNHLKKIHPHPLVKKQLSTAKATATKLITDRKSKQTKPKKETKSK